MKEIKLFEKNGITRTKEANDIVKGLVTSLNPWWRNMEKTGYSFWQIELLAQQAVTYIAAMKAINMSTDL